MLRDYLFTDNNTGEQFFVETTSEAHAWIIVNEEFGEEYVKENLEFGGVFSIAEAILMGLDTF